MSPPSTPHVFTQFARYAAVGLLANASIYLCYLLITSWGMDAKLAMTVLYASSVVATFVANRRWTFGGSARRSAFARYVATYFAGYLLNLLLLHLFVDRWHVAHQLAQAICIVVVAVFLFVTLRLCVFGATGLQAEPEK